MQDNMRGKFTKLRVEETLKQKKELVEQRHKDETDMKQLGGKAHSNVVRPEYAFDERLEI